MSIELRCYLLLSFPPTIKREFWISLYCCCNNSLFVGCHTPNMNTCWIFNACCKCSLYEKPPISVTYITSVRHTCDTEIRAFRILCINEQTWNAALEHTIHTHIDGQTFVALTSLVRSVCNRKNSDFIIHFANGLIKFPIEHDNEMKWVQMMYRESNWNK